MLTANQRASCSFRVAEASMVYDGVCACQAVSCSYFCPSTLWFMLAAVIYDAMPFLLAFVCLADVGPAR